MVAAGGSSLIVPRCISREDRVGRGHAADNRGEGKGCKEWGLEWAGDSYLIHGLK